MSASVTGTFLLMDRASGPLKRIQTQAERTDRAIADLGDRLDNVGTRGQMQKHEELGKSFKQMERNARDVDTTMNSVDRSTGKLGDSTDKLNTKLVRTGLKLGALGKIFGALKITFMVTAIGSLVQMLSAVGGGLTAMLPQIGQLLGSVVALLPNLLRLGSLTAAALPAIIGLGTAALGAKLAFSGFGEAVSEGGAALKKLEPQARKVAELLRTTGKEFKENLQVRAQSSFFGQMTADKLKKSAFSGSTQKSVGNIVGTGATTAGMAAENMVTGLARPAFLEDIERLAVRMQPVIVQLSDSFLNMAYAAKNVAVAAIPMAKWLGDIIHGWTEYARLTSSASRATGDMGRKFGDAMHTAEQFGRIVGKLWRVMGDVLGAADRAGKSLWDSAESGVTSWEKWTSSMEGRNRMATWFDHARESASTLWSVSKNIGAVLIDVGGASREVGDSLWEGFERTTAGWAKFTGSLEGQMKMADYFRDVMGPLKSFGGLVGDLAGAFVQLGRSKSVVATIDVLRKGVGPLAKSLDSLGTAFGPVLAESIVQLLRLFASLTTGGGVIAKVLEMFNSLLDVLNTVLEKFAFLGTVFTVVIAGLAMRKALGYLGMLSTAWGFVATQAGRAALAQKLAMGGAIPMGGGRGGRGGMNSPVGAPVPVRGGVRGGQPATPPIVAPMAAPGGGGGRMAGVGGLLKAGASAAVRFAGPVAALFALSDFITTEGGAAQKLQGALSGATLGLIPGPVTAEEAAAKGTQTARDNSASIVEQTGGGKSLAATRRSNQQIAALMKSNSAAEAGWAADAGGWLSENVPGGSDILGSYSQGKKDEVSSEFSGEQKGYRQALRAGRQQQGQQERSKADSFLDESIGAFGIRSKGQGLGAAGAAMTKDMLQQMGPNALGKAGGRALAANTLMWMKEQSKQNPKLVAVYEEMQKKVQKRFQGMGQNINVVNGQIFDGTKKQWLRIRENMTGQVEEARQENKRSFTAIQRDAVNALTQMGISGADARSMVTRADGTGGAPGGGGGTGAAVGASGSASGAAGAKGMRIPGNGTRDTVPLTLGMAAPGELIVNRHTESDIDRDLSAAGAPTLGQRVAGETRPHSASKHPGRGPGGPHLFHAKGGRVGGDVFGRGGRASYPDAMGALPGLDALAAIIQQKFGLSVTSGLRPGAITSSGNLSDHGWGGAIDVSNGVTTPEMDAANAWLVASLGPALKQILYRTMVGGNHYDHIHVALNESYANNADALLRVLGGGVGLTGAMAAGGGAAAPVQQLAFDKIQQQTKGKGYPGAMAQRGMDVQAKGMQEKINKELRRRGGGGGAVATGPLRSYDRMFGLGNEQTLPFNIIAQIAQSAGLPGVTFAQISQGESGYRPGAVGDDAAAGYGNTFGYGLWQITSGWNDELIARMGGPAAMTNPFINARAAKEIYDAQGLGAWYGDQFVTDPNAHWRGAKGGRIPSFGGWFGDGGSFTTNGPTMIGVGEKGKEHVSVTPAGKSTGSVGGRSVTIGSVHIENHREGDIKKQLKREIAAAFDELESELSNDTGGGIA